jgi:hypothetical protein
VRSAGAGDGDRQEHCPDYARCAEKKEEKHARVKGIFTGSVEDPREIIGKERAAGDPSLEIVALAGNREKCRLWVASEIASIEARMDLGANSVRSPYRLGIEERVPLVDWHNQDIVGRCLWRRTVRYSDRLEHRIRVGQVDHAVDDDHSVWRCGAVNDDAVTGPDVKIGGCLLGDQSPIGRA